MTAATDDSPWPLAGRIAGRIAGTHPLARSYHLDALAEEAPGIVSRVEPLVTHETRLDVPAISDVRVVDRSEWANRSIATFATLLGPVTDTLEAQAGEVATAVTALEVGTLLGVMARRVLGQYELVLPTGEATAADTVVLVAPNIFALERNHQFRPGEFRTWIALHEATHRAQFLGVPWLRDHFLGMAQSLVTERAPDPDRFLRLAGRVGSSLLGRRRLVDDTGLFGLFATEGQVEQVGRIQALMCLLEGHGHVVMDRIGGRILTSQARMSRLLKARRSDPRQAAFMRLTGMEMKMRQYELGERFVQGVTGAAGWEALDAAWESPETLPTLAEIEDPDGWLRRVA